MIERGFTFNGIDSSTYNLSVKTSNLPILPPKRNEAIYVIGRDKPYDFEQGYERKVISLDCTIHYTSHVERRYIVRQIAGWLASEGTLILNYEPDKQYSARIIDEVGLEMLTVYDSFSLEFEVELAERSFDLDGLTWNEASVPWEYADFPWEGITTEYTGIGTHVLVNYGTYKVLPLIKLTGVASTITLTLGDNTFTYTNLDGTIYIDCGNKLAYSSSGDIKTNQFANFDGDFLELAPGSNSVAVSGTVTSLVIDYQFRDTFL